MRRAAGMAESAVSAPARLNVIGPEGRENVAQGASPGTRSPPPPFIPSPPRGRRRDAAATVIPSLANAGEGAGGEGRTRTPTADAAGADLSVQVCAPEAQFNQRSQTRRVCASLRLYRPLRTQAHRRAHPRRSQGGGSQGPQARQAEARRRNPQLGTSAGESRSFTYTRSQTTRYRPLDSI